MMSDEILINHCLLESRVALMTNGVVSEILIERYQDVSLVGSIYVGTVVRVLSGMQAAFVDIGRGRTAFLHIDDMRKFAPMGKQNQSKQKANLDNLIEHRLYQGERILVQVIKDELGTKGARLTTNVSLPSRYLVYFPNDDDYVGVSTRLSNKTERIRLKKELTSLIQMLNFKGGWIARTVAKHIDKPKLEKDIHYLLKLWQIILARTSSAKLRKVKHELIYQEPLLPFRCLRDLGNEHTDRILVDDKTLYDELRTFSGELMPAMTDKIHYYYDDVPLFHAHGVEYVLSGALMSRVNLSSGGYLVIEQTEAMTTIDVNTGSFTGKYSLEETVYKTNLEAVCAIAHQIRLRNLGGIIILDFIDMDKQKHRDVVLNALQEVLQNDDSANTNIMGVSDLGLVEMTRTRTRESLSQQLCEPCSVCEGRGVLKTKETVSFDIVRRLLHLSSQVRQIDNITIVANVAVVDYLTSDDKKLINDLTKLSGVNVRIKSEPSYHQEQFDIIFD